MKQMILLVNKEVVERYFIGLLLLSINFTIYAIRHVIWDYDRVIKQFQKRTYPNRSKYKSSDRGYREVCRCKIDISM